MQWKRQSQIAVLEHLWETLLKNGLQAASISEHPIIFSWIIHIHSVFLSALILILYYVMSIDDN